MKKVVRLTESDLFRIVKKVISEQNKISNDWMTNIKNSDKNKSVCPAGFVVMSQQEISSYSKQLVKPWTNTTEGSGDYIVKNANTICKRAQLRNDPDKKVRVEEALATMRKQTFEQNMDMIREFASGGMGIAVSVGLDALGVGEIINPIFWILFLVYDIWLWFKKGVKNLFNIIIDIIGVISAGASTSYGKQMLSKLSKWVKGGVGSLVEGMAKETPEFFKWFSKITKFFKSIIAKLSTLFTESVPQLVKKVPMLSEGLNGMKGAVGSVKTFLMELELQIGKWSGSEAAHEIQHLGKHYGQHYAQHKIAHDVVGAAVGHGGHNLVKHGVNLVAKNTPQNKKAQQMIAQNINNPKVNKNNTRA